MLLIFFFERWTSVTPEVNYAWWSWFIIFFTLFAKLYWLIFYQGFCFCIHEGNKDLCNIFRYKKVYSKMYTKLNISTAINIVGTILEKIKGL